MLISVLAVILSVVGIIGCFAPVLPGPPLSYAALALIYFFGEPDVAAGISGSYMIWWLVITAIVTVLDYVVPAYFTKATGGSNSGAKGSIAGMFIGIFLVPPIGMILGAFLGALLSEMFFEGRGMRDSLKPAFGSFIGFLFGTGIKLIASVLMLIKLIRVLV